MLNEDVSLNNLNIQQLFITVMIKNPRLLRNYEQTD